MAKCLYELTVKCYLLSCVRKDTSNFLTELFIRFVETVWQSLLMMEARRELFSYRLVERLVNR